MQQLLTSWLELPIPGIFASLVVFYFGTAGLVVWLSFRSGLSPRIRSFKGVVAPFFGSTAVIFALLVGFLANDIWERNKQAVRAVLTESDTLLALYSVGAASGTDDGRLRTAIRAYAKAVVDDEWSRLAAQERSPQADSALNALLREVAQAGASTDATIRRTMLDMVLRIRTAHEDRVVLSSDRTAAGKWAAVLLLALITQIAIAAVHLEAPSSAIGRTRHLHARCGTHPGLVGRVRVALRSAGLCPSRADQRRTAADPGLSSSLCLFHHPAPISNDGRRVAALSPGATAWTTYSDRAGKANVVSVVDVPVLGGVRTADICHPMDASPVPASNARARSSPGALEIALEHANVNERRVGRVGPQVLAAKRTS